MTALMTTMDSRQHESYARKSPEPKQGMTLTKAQQELLQQSLYDSLQLPERTANALESVNVFTLEDLLLRTSDELMAISNFGEKTLADIYDRLERIGFYRPDRRPAVGTPPRPSQPAPVARPAFLDFGREDEAA